MANDNETVNDIRADVGEYLTSIEPSELPSETQVEEFADRFVAAHNREIAAKDAEIRELTKELLKKYAKDGVPLEAHNADMAASNREIMSLRALVKELADALDSYPCHNCKHGSERCEWCVKVHELDALVAKARGVVK